MTESPKNTRKLERFCGRIIHLLYYSETGHYESLADATADESALEIHNRSSVIILVLAVSFLGLLSQPGAVGVAAADATPFVARLAPYPAR